MRHGIAVLGLLILCGCSPEPVPLTGVGEGRIRVGDDPTWSRPDFDDSDWERAHWAVIETREVWWYRTRVVLPAEVIRPAIPLGVYVVAAGAAEIYWDGERIGSKGRVGADEDTENAGPMAAVFPLRRDLPGEHVLAMRFSAHRAGDRIATPVDAIYIAAFGSPLRFFRDRYLPSLIAGGALSLALAFLLVLWIRGPDSAAGWLALATLGALLQLALETSRAFAAYDYSLHAARLAAIGVATVVTGVGMLGFSHRRFRPHAASAPWLVAYTMPALGVVLLAGLGDRGTGLAILMWLLGAIALSALGARRRIPGAPLALIVFGALGMMLVLGTNDFLDRSLFMGLVAMLLLFFVEHVNTYARTRTEREQARLRTARLELELVKRHIQPHFLLNTLTGLSELIETDAHRATALIDALGREFHLFHDLVERERIDLAEEIALCRAHLHVMQFRFDAELELAVEGDPEDVRVPPAVIHTLLENALTHNVYDDGPVRFVVHIKRTPAGHRLRFRAPLGRGAMHDTGPGLGLGYVDARLEETYGPGHRAVSRREGGAWVTELEIPA
jgi:hypothetical protein